VARRRRNWSDGCLGDRRMGRRAAEPASAARIDGDRWFAALLQPLCRAVVAGSDTLASHAGPAARAGEATGAAVGGVLLQIGTVLVVAAGEPRRAGGRGVAASEAGREAAALAADPVTADPAAAVLTDGADMTTASAVVPRVQGYAGAAAAGTPLRAGVATGATVSGVTLDINADPAAAVLAAAADVATASAVVPRVQRNADAAAAAALPCPTDISTSTAVGGIVPETDADAAAAVLISPADMAAASAVSSRVQRDADAAATALPRHTRMAAGAAVGRVTEEIDTGPAAAVLPHGADLTAAPAVAPRVQRYAGAIAAAAVTWSTHMATGAAVG